MRSVPAAAVAAALTLALTSPITQAQTPAKTTHRATTGAAAQRRHTTAGTTTSSQEGLAAVGSMPAASGPVKTLFSLRYVDLKLGTGEPAETRKFYTVHYTGWTTEGQKFDSSFEHEGQEPIVFPVGARRVIVGWDTGFEGMRVGGKRRLIVPYQLAYGELGRPPVIPPKADLIFDVELLAEGDAPPQQPTSPPSSGATPGKPTPPQKPLQQPGSNPVTEPATQPATKPE